jgi:uncharacterized protein with HEPN domain
MSKRNWKLLFEDIMECIHKIEKYTGVLEFENFKTREIVIDAVVRNLEIIGEASRNIPEEVKKRFKDIPWKSIVGLRNRVIHGYFGVDLSIIWHIIGHELPDLKNKIQEALKQG